MDVLTVRARYDSATPLMRLLNPTIVHYRTEDDDSRLLYPYILDERLVGRSETEWAEYRLFPVPSEIGHFGDARQWLYKVQGLQPGTLRDLALILHSLAVPADDACGCGTLQILTVEPCVRVTDRRWPGWHQPVAAVLHAEPRWPSVTITIGDAMADALNRIHPAYVVTCV